MPSHRPLDRPLEAALLLLAACGDPSPVQPEASAVREAPTVDLPPGARPELEQQLLEDLALVRHPSDGGGRAWIEDPPETLVAGSSTSLVLVYEAGPMGVAEGGAVVFQGPPFWGWSPPQLRVPEAPGYTTVEAEADGVRLEPSVPDTGMLVMTVTGRALRPGERIRVVYGAGPAGAQVDRYAERGERLCFAVDGDGDGVRRWLDDCPTLDIVAAPPAGLLAWLPSVAGPGEPVDLVLAAVDAWGNAATADGPVELRLPEGLALEGPVALTDGTARVRLVPGVEGVMTVAARFAGELTALTNPMVVRAGAPHVRWADLQVHTGLSDGTGALDQVYRYARDVAGLDMIAVTDHDHWGIRFLDQHPEAWQGVIAAADAAYEPGRFVTVPAYEWTQWTHGHRHVLWFERPATLYSSLDPATRTPAGLWKALEGHRAITIAHHSAGGPVPVDWSFAPPPALEPVTELCSVHGSSESADTPGRIYSFVPGNTVRDQLARGYRLGLLCSTDGHDGHPGLAHLQAAQGGLAAILTEDLTREGLYRALQDRAVYGTNGVRSLLRFDVDGVGMGGTVDPRAAATATLRYVGTAPVASVALIRGRGEPIALEGGAEVVHHVVPLEDLRDGDWVYVRVVQQDGGTAWSSPIFVEAGGVP